MALPLLALAAKLLPFATAIPEVMRAFGGDKQADAAERIVGVAKAITGQKDPEKAVNAVIADPAMQLELQKALSAERIKFAEIAAEAEKHAASQVTSRWQADMTSDSRLSKNIRPLTLIFILAVYTLFGLMSAFGYSVNEAYVTLLGQWGMLIMSAYFVGRTVEKAIHMREKEGVAAK
jgi:hypothetical protein